MENSSFIKISSNYNNLISLKAAPGHFTTSSSHINFFIDMTTPKVRSSEAKAVAKTILQDYVHTTLIDTIVCMDETDVIGAYLADELTNAGFMSINTHPAIYVVTPEQNSVGQLIFRENTLKMIKDKNVLLLLATATTGRTVEKSLECIEYYGGNIAGVSALFSATKSVNGHQINGIFSSDDLPGYNTFSPSDCPYCKENIPITAIINSFGYSRL